MTKATPEARTPELPAWQRAAIEVFCRPRRCALHEAVARAEGAAAAADPEAICALIRATVGCPLFRCLTEMDESRD
jgi:hypothetical protein